MIRFMMKGGLMHRLSRVLIAVIILVLALSSLMFILENQQPVALSFLGWTAPQFPISIFILFALLTGMLIGPLIRIRGRNTRRER